MRDIAVAADLSPGNLYHYFTGKDEILFFCQDRTLDRLLKAAALARTGRGPLPGRLRALAIAHVLCILDQLEGSAAHLEVDALPPPLRARIVAKRDRYESRRHRRGRWPPSSVRASRCVTADLLAGFPFHLTSCGTLALGEVAHTAGSLPRTASRG